MASAKIAFLLFFFFFCFFFGFQERYTLYLNLVSRKLILPFAYLQGFHCGPNTRFFFSRQAYMVYGLAWALIGFLFRIVLRIKPASMESWISFPVSDDKLLNNQSVTRWWDNFIHSKQACAAMIPAEALTLPAQDSCTAGAAVANLALVCASQQCPGTPKMKHI